MKRFTVSLEEEIYDRLRVVAATRNPPATLQQMVRHAVVHILEPGSGAGDTDEGAAPGGNSESFEPDAVADHPDRAAPEPTDLSTFRIGAVWFGLPVSEVEGIAARTEIEYIPTMRHDVAGTIRYRDTLLAVIDASSRLGMLGADQSNGQHLVVRHPEGLIALAVEEVGALVAVDVGTWHAPPAGVADDMATIGVTALVDCGDRLVNVLSDFPA